MNRLLVLATCCVVLHGHQPTFDRLDLKSANGWASGVTADINLDGKIDLIEITSEWGFRDPRHKRSVRLGNGDGTFRVPQTSDLTNVITYPMVADFNGDGMPDLAGSTVWDRHAALQVFPGDGHGGFGEPIETLIGPLSVSGFLYRGGKFGIADFNRDGRLDVVIQAVEFIDGPLFVLSGRGR